MIWTNQGQIDDVKSYLMNKRGFSNIGLGCGSEYLNTYEASNTNKPQWDADCGIVSSCEPVPGGASGEGRHMHTRLYAPTSNPYYDQFYSVELGYYIFGTTHYDINHDSGCGSGAERFGSSEEVEQRIGGFAAADGLNVLSSHWCVYNNGYGNYDWSANHYHESDGCATEVQFRLPLPTSTPTATPTRTAVPTATNTPTGGGGTGK